ncbi:hypothetical protein ACFVYP_27025 [Kitasatospora sp. NPDC058201]|uniref:hypothetical protein n=1 Tax=unclassified Kitasatospora TaxID=2633591 RepID=UPI003653DCE9
MFHSSAHPGRPVDPTWPELLRSFGRPAALLDAPRPGWQCLVGQGSTDGLLQRLDLGYHEGRTLLVQVSTQRRLPAHVRVFPTLDPEALLRDFLVNSSPDGPIPLPSGPVLGAGRLVVDGTAMAARRLTWGAYTATLAVIGAAGTDASGEERGEESIAVVSGTALHREAVRLTLDTSGVPA